MTQPYRRKEQIGDAALYLGDSLEILPTLPKVDSVVTDPPYGMGLQYSRINNRGTARHGVNISGDSDLSLRNWLIQNQVADSWVVFGTWKQARPEETRIVLIWDKGSHVGMGDLKFPWKLTHEEIYIWGKGFTGNRDTSVLSGFPALYPNLAAANIKRAEPLQHPTQKPIKLMEYLIDKTDGKTIFDPFMGSGTTGVACANLGRKFIGIEICESYFNTACERIAAAYAQGRLFQ